MKDTIKYYGNIVAILDYKYKKETIKFPNTILNSGRKFLTNCLIGPNNNLYIARMLFGDGGMNQGVKKIVSADRSELFGITRVNKPLIAQIDPQEPSQAIFTSVITFEEGNGYTLNEMALQLSDNSLFSMATFPNLGKNEQLQVTWCWKVSNL